jgi:hypothetical protein
MSIIGYYFVGHYVDDRRYMGYFYECESFCLNDNDEIVNYRDATKSVWRYLDKDGNVAYESVDDVIKKFPPFLISGKP